MSVSSLVTLVIIVSLVGFILFRQMVRRLVSQRSLLMPVLLSFLLGGIFVVSNPTAEAAITVLVGLLFGILSGFISGQFMRVWRDDNTGWVYQKGNWRYLLTVLALVVIRFAVRIALHAAGSAVDETALNDALIAAVVGNYLGRTIKIALRVLPLVGGNLGNLLAGS
jgi:CcdC protein